MEWNVPNLVSIFRTALAFYSFWLYLDNQNQWLFFALTIIVICLDGLDGILARKLNQSTVFGAKLDILCDRIVELAYWLFFAYISVLHIWVFIFFLLRGIAVDYLSRKNDKPLGNSFLRSSRFMRFAYGFLKLLSFCLLILLPVWEVNIFGLSFDLTQWAVYLTVLVCFLRAWPVFIDSMQKN